MEALIFNFFGILFRMVGLLTVGSVLVAALTDIQRKAFDSKHTGLVTYSKLISNSLAKLASIKSVR